MGMSEAESLAFAMGNSLPVDRYAALLPAVKDALAQSNCNNPRRVAAWLSQIGHESAGLRYMHEIADGWAYEGRADLGNLQQGDGPRFRGAGPIQITGRSNFEQVSQWAFNNGYVSTPTYFVDHPAELSGDTYGMLGAVWYWTIARGDRINEAADREDIEGVTRLINGGLHGIDDRRQRYFKALQVADVFLHAPPPPPPPVSHTPLSGRPWHHSVEEDLQGQILNLRAEGLLAQALVFAIAEKVGVDARKLYEDVRNSF